jgi:Sulfatase
MKRFFTLLLSILCVHSSARAASLRTKNVFLIISDGFRWQEVFNGAEADLMTKENGVRNPDDLKGHYWRDTTEARRAALLPFIWSEIASNGQILGNETKGSVVTVSNGRKFSYPGYNEILTGFGDPQIDSNDKIPNRNETVFEWLNARPQLHGRAAVFGTWDVFPYIFNVERSHLPIWPAWESRFSGFEIPVPNFVTEIRHDTTAIWDDLTYDSFLFEATDGYVKKERPRLVFVGFGETDEWAHAGRYDLYLNAAHHVDDFVRRLWATVQSMNQYRGKTTFILTADHGRGSGQKGWRDHGEKAEGAEGDWIAIIGPDTAAAGERTGTPPLTESQIAATIAALLGEDFHGAFPRSGTPISPLIGFVR